jgi:hypothetical protein
MQMTTSGSDDLVEIFRAAAHRRTEMVTRVKAKKRLK